MELQDHPFFGFFKSSIARKLIKSAEIKNCGINTIIFKEGDPSDCIYLVLKGEVKLTKGETEQKFIASVTAGDFFGEFGVLDGKPRSARATTDGVLTLVVIKRSALLSSLGSKTDSAALRMAIQIISKVRESNQQHVEELLQRERLSLLGHMVACMAHDFRNPFAIINMSAGAIQKETNGAVEEYCRMIEAQVNRVTAMADDVLDYTREETSLHLEPIDIADALRSFQQLNTPFLDTHHVSLDVLSQSCFIQADSEKLMRILQNLVYNAVESLKGEAGTITIHQEILDETVCIHIQDDGPGIPVEIQGHLFKPFTTHGKRKGLGLGMTIAHHFIQAHGGSINFATSREGTVFHIHLPRKK